MTGFVAGDTRVNEQIGLTAMHTLWMREHNHWATNLAQQNPTWTDEQLYQQARKIVGAEIQAITYNEWLPTLMAGNALGAYNGYDPAVDPRVTNEFTTAAFRLGHTLLQPTLLRLDANGNPIPEGNVSLRDAFIKPALIPDEGGIDPILRGLAVANAQEFDAKIIDDVRNFLFGAPGSGGQDLGSLNIQRGRDHGLPDYNSLRTQLGLTPYDDISDITSDAGLAAALTSVYGDINNIDPWVGIIAEDHYANAIFGETAFTILKQQFEALRDGDRFWYENDPALAALLPTLGSTTLAAIIGRNTGIDIAGVQGSLFHVQAAPVPLPPAVWLLLSALSALGVIGHRRRSRS
jgi:hypothetical protein